MLKKIQIFHADDNNTYYDENKFELILNGLLSFFSISLTPFYIHRNNLSIYDHKKAINALNRIEYIPSTNELHKEVNNYDEVHDIIRNHSLYDIYIIDICWKDSLGREKSTAGFDLIETLKQRNFSPKTIFVYTAYASKYIKHQNLHLPSHFSVITLDNEDPEEDLKNKLPEALQLVTKKYFNKLNNKEIDSLLTLINNSTEKYFLESTYKFGHDTFRMKDLLVGYLNPETGKIKNAQLISHNLLNEINTFRLNKRKYVLKTTKERLSLDKKNFSKLWRENEDLQNFLFNHINSPLYYKQISKLDLEAIDYIVRFHSGEFSRNFKYPFIQSEIDELTFTNRLIIRRVFLIWTKYLTANPKSNYFKVIYETVHDIKEGGTQVWKTINRKLGFTMIRNTAMNSTINTNKNSLLIEEEFFNEKYLQNLRGLLNDSNDLLQTINFYQKDTHYYSLIDCFYLLKNQAFSSDIKSINRNKKSTKIISSSSSLSYLYDKFLSQ